MKALTKWIAIPIVLVFIRGLTDLAEWLDPKDPMAGIKFMGAIIIVTLLSRDWDRLIDGDHDDKAPKEPEQF